MQVETHLARVEHHRYRRQTLAVLGRHCIASLASRYAGATPSPRLAEEVLWRREGFMLGDKPRVDAIALDGRSMTSKVHCCGRVLVYMMHYHIY